MTDFDGYIQYLDGNFKRCLLIENESSILKKYYELLSNKQHLYTKYAIFNKDDVPEINNLLPSFPDFDYYLYLYKTSFKFMYAGAWYNEARYPPEDDVDVKNRLLQEKNEVKKILSRGIRVTESLFIDMKQIHMLSEEIQMLVLSKILLLTNASPLIDGKKWADISEEDLTYTKNYDGKEYDLWQQFFYHKFNLSTSLLSVDFQRFFDFD
jgi:hypothetical protein